MVDTIVYMVIIIPMAALFTGLGVFAWKRKKPMWFWAGSTVKEEEITNVRAYNRANGIMWIAYSLVFWAGVVVGIFNLTAAGLTIGIGCIAGIPVLMLVYRAVYKKYKVK